MSSRPADYLLSMSVVAFVLACLLIGYNQKQKGLTDDEPADELVLKQAIIISVDKEDKITTRDTLVLVSRKLVKDEK